MPNDVPQASYPAANPNPSGAPIFLRPVRSQRPFLPAMPPGRTGTKTSLARSAGGRQVRIFVCPMFSIPGNKNGIRRTANPTAGVKNRRLAFCRNFLLLFISRVGNGRKRMQIMAAIFSGWKNREGRRKGRHLLLSRRQTSGRQESPCEHSLPIPSVRKPKIFLRQ